MEKIEESESKDVVIQSNPMECNMCGTQSNKIEELEMHVRGHFKEQKFLCKACNQHFFVFSDYVKHVKEQHKNKNVFSCRICNWQCQREPLKLLEHESIHSPEQLPFDCFKCGAAFRQVIQLRGHQRRCKGNPACVCHICHASFTRSTDLSVHHRVHENLPIYECKFCCKLFATIKNFGRHLINRHQLKLESNQLISIQVGLDEEDERVLGTCSFIREYSISNNHSDEVKSSANDALMRMYDLEKKFPCSKCSVVFVKNKTLEIHSKLMHYDNNIFEQLECPQGGRVLCTLCQEAPAAADLVSHMYKTHNGIKPYKCKACQLTFSRPTSLEEHAKLHYKQTRKCKYCPKQFDSNQEFEQHTKTHREDQSFQCTVCEISFTNKRSLSNHNKIHFRGRPHKCDFCEKRFAQSGDKIKHMRTHTGEKPHVCKKCGIGFSHLTSLRNHLASHSSIKNYQCAVCGKAFRLKGNLIVHNRTHTGERPYVCSVCGKSFHTSGNLKDHSRLHTSEKSFQCNICSKSFTHKSSLYKHKVTHSGERQFPCSLCTKSFKQQIHLKLHLRTHTGEKPYSCKECNKSFNRLDSLKTHMRTKNKHLNEEISENLSS